MKPCPYCAGSSGKFFFRINERTYRRCRDCDLIYKQTRAAYEEILTPYRDQYFHLYSEDQTGRDSLYHHILSRIEKEIPAGRLLDVGTGIGRFPVTARHRGWQVNALDPSVESIDCAISQGIDAFCGTLREYQADAPFDVITFINVLEHSAAPWDELRYAKQILKPKGLVFIRFLNGNLHSMLYRCAETCGMGSQIAPYLVFHEFAFTPKFIKRFLTDNGFSVIVLKNSPPSLFTHSDAGRYIRRAVHLGAVAIDIFSRSAILAGTSLNVMARG